MAGNLWKADSARIRRRPAYAVLVSEILMGAICATVPITRENEFRAQVLDLLHTANSEQYFFEKVITGDEVMSLWL